MGAEAEIDAGDYASQKELREQLEFILRPLRENPQRAGGRLHAERAGRHSARVGPYRVIYRIDEQARRARREVAPAPTWRALASRAVS